MYKIDLHVHTSRYSPCSRIDPKDLVHTASEAGLDAIVITEHGRMWSRDEVEELRRSAPTNKLVVLAGAEIYTGRGDILVFGIEEIGPLVAAENPETVVSRTHDQGGVAIAAHPTRFGLEFGAEIFHLPLDAIEVMSGNMASSEWVEAMRICEATGVPPVSCSDAHTLGMLGGFYTMFDDPIRTETELTIAIKCRRFCAQPLETGSKR